MDLPLGLSLLSLAISGGSLAFSLNIRKTLKSGSFELTKSQLAHIQEAVTQQMRDSISHEVKTSILQEIQSSSTSLQASEIGSKVGRQTAKGDGNIQVGGNAGNINARKP